MKQGVGRCLNPYPKLDPYTAFLADFYCSSSVQNAFEFQVLEMAGVSIPIGVKPSELQVLAKQHGFEITEHSAEKLALCQQVQREWLKPKKK